jgi:hypothetical protein
MKWNKKQNFLQIQYCINVDTAAQNKYLLVPILVELSESFFLYRNKTYLFLFLF